MIYISNTIEAPNKDVHKQITVKYLQTQGTGSS